MVGENPSKSELENNDSTKRSYELLQLDEQSIQFEKFSNEEVVKDKDWRHSINEENKMISNNKEYSLHPQSKKQNTSYKVQSNKKDNEKLLVKLIVEDNSSKRIMEVTESKQISSKRLMEENSTSNSVNLIQIEINIKKVIKLENSVNNKW